jgi:hypothetical protein
MEFIDSDFSKLHIPVHKDLGDNVDVVKRHRLDIYPEFNDEIPTNLKLSKNKIIKYIVYVYDKYSPLHKITEIMGRKIIAAELAGFNKKGGKFGGNIEKMLLCEIPQINKMIVRYCRIQKDSDWSVRVAYEDSLYSQLEAIRNSQEGKDVKDIILNTDTLRSKISDLDKILLEGDDNENLVFDIYDTIENETLELKPEDMADKIEAGYGKKNRIRIRGEQLSDSGSSSREIP